MSLAMVAGNSQAQDDEFAAFRITDVEGSLTLKQLHDRSEARSGAADAASAQADRSTTLTASVSARGFVYHPNLVALEGGFGLIGQRSRFSSGALGEFGDTRASETLYDLSTRVTLLRDKPYTASLYYEHLNPSVSVGPALVMVQETTRRGLQLALLEPFTPVPMSFDAERMRSLGRGSGRLVDERSERYSLTADRVLGKLGSTRLRVDNTRLDSQSGSVGLPISRTASSALTAGLDTRLQFGDHKRYAFTHLITYNALSYTLGAEPPADRKELRTYLDLRARHSAQLQSFATLDLMNTRQGLLRSRSRAALGGATWTPVPDWVSTLEARSESLDATDYASSTRSTLASTSYQWAWAGGRAQAAYAARHDLRSQRATSATTPVIGERHALAGTAAVALDRPRVAAASGLQVSNTARTQVYVEGRDYQVSVLGEQTRLERVLSGDIIDGQTVLVDYAVETGGSFDSTQLDQTLSLSWSWANRVSLTARWIDSVPRVSSGVPLLTLNTVRGRTLRAQADLPVVGLWSAGGSVEQEDRRETILPFQRTAADIYVQWEEAFFGQGGIRVGVHRQRVAYDQALQDIDLVGYDIRYRVFTSDGVDIQADWTAEADSGRVVKRRRDFGSLRARWRFRQLLMTLSLTRAHESQDSLQTTRTVGQWLLQRDF